MREMELKITNKGIVRLRKGETLTWENEDPPKIVVKMRYVNRQEEAKIMLEILSEMEEK